MPVNYDEKALWHFSFCLNNFGVFLRQSAAKHSIDQGVVPILSTKADNDEGDHYIN